MNVIRCMLNGAALPKSLWGNDPAVFLFSRLSNKTIGGNTSNYWMFGKRVGLSFCVLLGPVHMGTVKRTSRLLHDTPNLHITYSRNGTFELIIFCDAAYATGNAEKARSTLESMHFLSGGSSTSPPASSATARGLCS